MVSNHPYVLSPPENFLEACMFPVMSVRQKIRVKKEDSAFVYFILESHEGIASYSTLDFQKGDLYRDLELRIPTDFITEVQEVLQSLGGMIHLI